MKGACDRSENFIKKLNKSGFYSMIKLADTYLDIDDSEWDICLDGMRRRYMRKKHS